MRRVEGLKCEVCKLPVRWWQKKVYSMDGVHVAHRACRPEGFHKERKRMEKP